MILPKNLSDNVPLLQGKFKDAETLARADVKFLCILLISPDHPACTRRNCLTNLFTKDAQGELDGMLSRRCVVWAANIDDVAAADDNVENSSPSAKCVDSVITTCNPVSFPYFAVTFKNKLLMDIQGCGFTADEFKRQLQKCFNDADTIVAKEVAFAADRNAREAEREAMERAEREMLEADRKKAEAKKRAAEEKENKEREESERLNRLLREAEERKKQEEQKLLAAEEKKALAMSAVPIEPDQATTPADQIANIRLTFLNGKTAQRLFFRSTPLSGLYCWAESLPEYDHAADGDIELMAAGHPQPKLIERTDSITIGETRALIPRCVVTMRKKQQQ